MIVAIARGLSMFMKGYGMANLGREAPTTRLTVFGMVPATKQFNAATVLQNG